MLWVWRRTGKTTTRWGDLLGIGDVFRRTKEESDALLFGEIGLKREKNGNKKREESSKEEKNGEFSGSYAMPKAAGKLLQLA